MSGPEKKWRYMDRQDNRWAVYGTLIGFVLSEALVVVMALLGIHVGLIVAALLGWAGPVGGFWAGGELAMRRMYPEDYR
jgi:hypothetical protein